MGCSHHNISDQVSFEKSDMDEKLELKVFMIQAANMRGYRYCHVVIRVTQSIRTSYFPLSHNDYPHKSGRTFSV